MANRIKLTPPVRAKFLAVLSETANVSRAAEAINVSRRALYDARDADEEFAAEWAKAVDLGTDALEDEAVRRAHEGVLKPVFQQGREVGQVREYSDHLMVTMLKARRPEKFKDRVASEVTGRDGGPVQMEVVQQATEALAELISQITAEKSSLK